MSPPGPLAERRAPSRSPAARDDRVESILSAAAEVFSRKGFAATSMRAIAKRSGASLGSIYYHFEGKDDLLRELICAHFRRVQEALDRRLDRRLEPREELAVFIANHVGFFADHLDAMRVMSHELDTLQGAAGREVAAQRQAYSRRLVGILARVRPELSAGELRLHALCLFGMLNWTYRWFHTVDPAIGPGGLAARMTRLFLDGFNG